MATLTNTVFFSKKALFIVGSIIALVIILLVLSRLIGSVKNIFFPPSGVPATVAFDKIGAVNLAEGIKPLDNMHYTVETISGELPALSAFAKVFKIAEPVPTFGNLQDASQRATGAGFNTQPKELSSGIVKFVDPKDNTRQLTIETASQSIALTSQYLNNPEIFTAKLKSQEDPKRVAINFFESLKLPIKNFPTDKIFLENYKIESGTVDKAISLADTNLVKVIFVRDNIDSLPIINPDFDNPLVFALATDKKVVSANYTVNNIQKFKFSTYPLKGTSAAFEDLKNGKGALNKMPKSNAFPIRNIILGYLETKKYQPYLLPVYIFVSDDGFLAYVGAVSDAWTIGN